MYLAFFTNKHKIVQAYIKSCNFLIATLIGEIHFLMKKVIPMFKQDKLLEIANTVIYADKRRFENVFV